MLATTAQKFGSLGKSFKSPSAAAAVIGAALLASGTTDTAETSWSPAAACLLPDVLPVAGTLLSYGGSRQLAAGGTVTHGGSIAVGGSNSGLSGTGLLISPTTGRISGNSWPSYDYGWIDIRNSVKLGRGLSQIAEFDGGAVSFGTNTLTCGAITTTSSGVSCEVDPVNWRFRLSTAGTSRMDLDQYSLRLVDSAAILWSNVGNNVNTTKLLGLCKNDTTHYLQINNGTEGTLNGLECSAITASGDCDLRGSVYLNQGSGYTYVRGNRTLVLGSANPGNAQISSDYTGVANTATLTVGDPYGGYSNLACGAITASGAIQETPTQSSLNPTTTDIPSGKRMGWYNTTLSEFRDWVNIGGTLLKSAAYT